MGEIFHSPPPTKTGLLTNKGKLYKTTGVRWPSLLFCRNARSLGTRIASHYRHMQTVIHASRSRSPRGGLGSPVCSAAVWLCEHRLAGCSEPPHPPWVQGTLEPRSGPAGLPPYPLGQMLSFILSAWGKHCVEENLQRKLSGSAKGTSPSKRRKKK